MAYLRWFAAPGRLIDVRDGTFYAAVLPYGHGPQPIVLPRANTLMGSNFCALLSRRRRQLPN